MSELSVSKNQEIPRHVRLQILRECLDWIAGKPDIRIITVVVDKTGKPDAETVFRIAWQTLVQWFENTLSYRNFTGPANSDDRGMLIPDNTNGELLNGIVRRMRRFNPISRDLGEYGEGYRNLPLNHIIEDPFIKDSGDSLFLQMIDVVVYFAGQLYPSNRYVKEKGARPYYQRLDPVTLKVASRRHPLGIVER